jgi:uncharacterized protein (TIGR02271 family)
MDRGSCGEADGPINYRDVHFNGRDVMGMSVYSAENQKVGRVCQLLADEAGNICYLVVRLGFWKRVMLPVEQAAYVSHGESTRESSPHEDHLYVGTLSKKEFKGLADYVDSEISSDLHSTQAYHMAALEESVRSRGTSANFSPSFSQTAPQGQIVQLYEERLVTQKQRVKTGEVKIYRRMVTDTTNVAVPVTKEKIIIEIESVYGNDTRVKFGDAQTEEDGSVRMGIYEDQVDICRQVVPYQAVSVRKEVVQDVVEAQATLRREELAVNPDGASYVDRHDLRESGFVDKSDLNGVNRP